MRSPHKVWIEVDQDLHRKVEVNGIELYNPVAEGSIYESTPYQGILRFAPANLNIPIGTKVFTNHLAADDLRNVDGVDYYISDPSLVVAYGEEMNPYKCLIVKPVENEFKSDLFLIPREKSYETTQAEVLKSDVEGFKAGDIIEYQKNLDWEILLGVEKAYYIQWTDKIYKRNGELINGYNQITPREPYTQESGIWLPNKQEGEPCIDGEFKGKRVAVTARQHIHKGGFINQEFIGGCYN